MNPELIRRFWTWLGVVTLSTAALAFLRTTGLEVDIPVPGLSKQSPYGITVLAIPVVGAMTLALHWLVRAYADAFPDAPAARRIPLAFAKPEHVDTGSAGGRRYVWGFFWLFAALPVLLLVPLYVKLLKGAAQLRDGPRVAQGAEHFWPPVPIDWARFNDYTLDHGPTYFPLLTPYAYLVLIAVCVYSAARLWGHATHVKAAGPSPRPLENSDARS